MREFFNYLSSLIIQSAPSGEGLGLVPIIGLAVIAAASIALIFNRIKQPALLGYIVAGLLLSIFAKPLIGDGAHGVEEISHLGLVFLLFIIGLEMDLKGIMGLGSRAAIAVLAQTPVTIAAVLGIHWGLDAAGIVIPGLASSKAGWFIFSVVIALSSTAVVVKLLDEKFDLSSQAGKLTVLTLIAQDIYAVLALSYISTQGDSGGADKPGVVMMIGGALLLGVAIIYTAKYILSHVFSFLAKAPDLIALTALGWCFLCAAGFSKIGLSSEMGALIAGISLGALPVSAEILAKVSSLRDFFMALFFVALGMSLPTPTMSILVNSLILTGIVLLARFILFTPMLLGAGMGPIVSFAAPLNLAQVSEFSLLLLPLGLASGALTVDDVSTVSYALMISAVLSSYLIKNNYTIAIAMQRLFGMDRQQSTASQAHSAVSTAGSSHGHGHQYDIVMLGYFVNAEGIVMAIKRDNPELLKKILVIDFNLKNHPKIKAHGLHVVYGDISNPDTLRHFGISGAKVVLSTISDLFLRGTSNEDLLDFVRSINPNVRFISTAETEEKMTLLRKRGAYAVVSPPEQSASEYIARITEALTSK